MSTWLGHELPRDLVKHYAECDCKKYFWMKLILKPYISKMMEEKDMSSSSPARTPKSQLAAEQPLKGGCWNPPEKIIPHVQGQRRSWNRTVGGAQSCLISNLISTRDSWRAQTKPCVPPDPRKEAVITTKDWARPVCACLMTSCVGMGQQWPATGTGALATEVLGGTVYGVSPPGGGHH